MGKNWFRAGLWGVSSLASRVHETDISCFIHVFYQELSGILKTINSGGGRNRMVVGLYHIIVGRGPRAYATAKHRRLCRNTINA